MSCLPDKVNILGIRYTIEYVDRPSDVDIFKRTSLWGQIDYWTRSIRVYNNGLSEEDVWGTILHEVIHGIVNALHISRFDDDKANDDIDLLAMALVDTAVRNGWVTL